MANVDVYLIKNKDGEYRSRGKNVHYTPDMRRARLYISRNQADSIVNVESAVWAKDGTVEHIVNSDYSVKAILSEDGLCISKEDAFILYPLLTTEYTKILKERYQEKDLNGTSSVRYGELGNQLQDMADLKSRMAEFIEDEDE